MLYIQNKKLSTRFALSVLNLITFISLVPVSVRGAGLNRDHILDGCQLSSQDLEKLRGLAEFHPGGTLKKYTSSWDHPLPIYINFNNSLIKLDFLQCDDRGFVEEFRLFDIRPIGLPPYDLFHAKFGQFSFDVGVQYISLGLGQPVGVETGRISFGTLSGTQTVLTKNGFKISLRGGLKVFLDENGFVTKYSDPEKGLPDPVSLNPDLNCSVKTDKTVRKELGYLYFPDNLPRYSNLYLKYMSSLFSTKDLSISFEPLENRTTEPFWFITGKQNKFRSKIFMTICESELNHIITKSSVILNDLAVESPSLIFKLIPKQYPEYGRSEEIPGYPIFGDDRYLGPEETCIAIQDSLNKLNKDGLNRFLRFDSVCTPKDGHLTVYLGPKPNKKR